MASYDITIKMTAYRPAHYFGIFEGKTKNEALVSLFCTNGFTNVDYDEETDEIVYPDEDIEILLGTTDDFIIKERRYK